MDVMLVRVVCLPALLSSVGYGIVWPCCVAVARLEMLSSACLPVDSEKIQEDFVWDCDTDNFFFDFYFYFSGPPLSL